MAQVQLLNETGLAWAKSPEGIESQRIVFAVLYDFITQAVKEDGKEARYFNFYENGVTRVAIKMGAADVHTAIKRLRELEYVYASSGKAEYLKASKKGLAAWEKLPEETRVEYQSRVRQAHKDLQEEFRRKAMNAPGMVTGRA